MTLAPAGAALAQTNDAGQSGAESAAKEAATAVKEAEAAARESEASAKAAEKTVEAAVTKAEAAAGKADTIVDLIQWLALAFGIIAGVVGYFGFRKQQSFDEVLLDMRRIQSEMRDKAREIEAVRAELGGLKESLRREFDEARQALVLLALGNKVYDGGDVGEAIRYYEGARSLLPDDPDINYRLGRACVNSERYDDAVRALQKAVGARPNFPEAHMELGLAFRRHADTARPAPERETMYRLAEHHLLRAVDLRPDYADALGTLGGLYRREGDYAKALECYARAERADPNISYGTGNIASLAWHEGQRERALEYFARVEKGAADNVAAGGERAMWALFDRALARLALGRQEEALRDHAEALALTKAPGHLDSVLSNLRFLAGPPHPMPGVEKLIEMVEAKRR